MTFVAEPMTAAGLSAIETRRPDFTEWLFTVTRVGSETAEAMFSRLGHAIAASGSRPAVQQVFGVADSPRLRAQLRDLANGARWPITWIDEGADVAGAPAGTWVRAIAGAKVSPLFAADDVIGTTYEDRHATYCELGDLRCADPALPPAAQSEAIFQMMPSCLSLAGMTFAEVVRTWFINHHITRWYGDFNKVRTGFFDAHRVWDGLLPASTGVGGHNSAGSALVAGSLAMKPKSAQARAQIVHSPLQCPAPKYGSSFARAVEMSTPGYRWLTISGTASIDPVGNTVHLGDTARQIDLTLEVVHAILASRSLKWGDIARSVAYFRNASDAHLLHERLARAGISPFPAIPCRMDICRDNLLFELEADAICTQG